MERDNQPDDIFVWCCSWDYWWCYRKDWDEAAQGTPDDILQTETPEWVAFMENEA